MATRPSVQPHSTRRKDKDENVDAETVGQENVSGFTRFRTVIVLAIIFACFALIYPRFIHPAIKQAFGSKTDKKSEHFEDKFLPPKFQHRPTTPHPGHPPSNMQKRPTHHPGSRFTGEHGHVPASKGGIYFMLPLYTVGIIVFLLYTFYKILSRESYQTKDPYNAPSTSSSNIRYNPAEQNFISDPVAAHYDHYDDRNIQAEEEENDEFEESAVKITEFQLRALETKLAETEAQMKALIEQMQSAANTVAKTLPADDDTNEEGEGSEGELEDNIENDEELSITGTEEEDGENEEEVLPLDALGDSRKVPVVEKNKNVEEPDDNEEVYERHPAPEEYSEWSTMEKENKKPEAKD